MRVTYVASDGEKFDTEADCLKHEKESPLFKTYDHRGRPIEVGQGVHLLHLVDSLKGGEAFVRLCKEREESCEGIASYSSTGWYWWNSSRFCCVDERMVRAMMRARYNIEVTD